MTNRFDPFNKLRAGKLTTGYHLAILKKSYLYAILAGRKKIESRFTKTKHHDFGRVLAGDKLFLKQSRSDCRFGFLAWLETVMPIEPVRINKKDWRAWVVLTKKENFGLLK